MDYSSKEGSSYFAAIADSYDRLQPVLSPPYSKGLEMIVELIPFDPDDAFEFVELGCGTAEPTARVLDRFRNATGTCVDSEPEMLSLARKKLGPHSDRAEVLEADMAGCDIRECDLVLSAKAVHHLSPSCLPGLFARIAGALRPGGGFILYDAMAIGPSSGPGSRSLSSRFRRLHLQRAVASGMATQEEIDARQEYKGRMKAAGKDVEYEHRTEDLIGAMAQAGFDEVAVVWRMFADTILLAFTPEAEASAADGRCC